MNTFYVLFTLTIVFISFPFIRFNMQLQVGNILSYVTQEKCKIYKAEPYRNNVHAIGQHGKTMEHIKMSLM